MDLVRDRWKAIQFQGKHPVINFYCLFNLCLQGAKNEPSKNLDLIAQLLVTHAFDTLDAYKGPLSVLVIFSLLYNYLPLIVEARATSNQPGTTNPQASGG